MVLLSKCNLTLVLTFVIHYKKIVIMFTISDFIIYSVTINKAQVAVGCIRLFSSALKCFTLHKKNIFIISLKLCRRRKLCEGSREWVGSALSATFHYFQMFISFPCASWPRICCSRRPELASGRQRPVHILSGSDRNRIVC